MTIEEKIRVISKITGVSFINGGWYTDSFVGITYFLYKNNLISSNDYKKLQTIHSRNNFVSHCRLQVPLNNESLLFINLVYNIIKNSTNL